MTEPTEPADYSHYESTQTGIPPIPPPPPPPVSRRKWWHIAVPILMVVALVALILVPNIALSKPPAHTLATHFDPGGTVAAQAGATQAAAGTATASVPTPTAHPTIIVETPTVDTSYTATDILSDLGKDGAPIGDVTYGTTIWSFSDDNYYVSVHATSSATWLDPPQTAGAASVGLWVYNSPSDAESAYTQVGVDELDPNSTLPHYLWPNEFLHGRCLLLITGWSSATAPWQGYQQALSQYCM
jgi:hypothetical protein